MRVHDLEHSNSVPYARIINRDSTPLFINFCSIICILHNKKLNLANIFLLILKEENILHLYFEICELDSKYDALKQFLEYDSTLHKSKYIKKYLNMMTVMKCKRRRNDRSRKKNI